MMRNANPAIKPSADDALSFHPSGEGKGLTKGALLAMPVVFLAGVLLLLLGCTYPPAAEAQKRGQERALPDYLSKDESLAAKVYREVLPAVVTIFTSQEVIQQEGTVQTGGIGSGVLISPECHVLTAAHVVRGADQIMVKTQDGKIRPAEMLFSEMSADIALIKLTRQQDPDLKYAELGDSDRLVVGQAAYAIGSPYGLENSFSAGHISGFRNFDRYYDGAVQAMGDRDAGKKIRNSFHPDRNDMIWMSTYFLTSVPVPEHGEMTELGVFAPLGRLPDRVYEKCMASCPYLFRIGHTPGTFPKTA